VFGITCQNNPLLYLPKHYLPSEFYSNLDNVENLGQLNRTTRIDYLADDRVRDEMYVKNVHHSCKSLMV
jgi:hypothetical protein